MYTSPQLNIFNYFYKKIKNSLNFLNLVKDIHLDIQEAQWTPRKTNTEKNKPGSSRVKFLKISLLNREP